ncbi:hypothetical protein HHK36_005985 [Tetracentron sinense]|uniref:RRM domain-containing protein n=1 Tax=Tetracentron sinense TaxID=13715 RepID=A0A835DNV0_TETSI|nr:hypothetical protein HHK36_005985 [Tetracentron sinense]
MHVLLMDVIVTDGVPRASFPGYLPPEASSIASHHLWSSNDLRGPTSDYLQKDILPLRPGAYGLDDIPSIGSRLTPGIGGLTTGASIMGFPGPLEDPTLIGQRRDVALGISSGIPDILNEKSSLRKVDGLPAEESNILFVDGLPNDCTRREFVLTLYGNVKLQSGDKAMVLCFVEFNDAKCALTAMEALQGYKFDDKKPDAPILRIQFAQFPFRPTSNHDDRQCGGSR